MRRLYRMFVVRLYRLLPKGLFPRTLLIIAAPLVLLQSILTFVSMERHWARVTTTLSRATAQEISVLVGIYKRAPRDEANRQLVINMGAKLGLKVHFLPDKRLPPPFKQRFFDILDTRLGDELQRAVMRPYWIDAYEHAKLVEVRIQLYGEVLKVMLSRKQTYASNSHIFIAWMLGTSSILLAVAVMFLRNQITPILSLAEAAERFGKGLPPPEGFCVRGALEVRKASLAFLRMRDRIERHVEQRTTMLAGVSHDLRTILTRFKLELALTPDTPEIVAMRKDVDEMQSMINAYVDFAKGEGNETTSVIRFDELLREIRSDMSRVNKTIQLSSKTDGLEVPLRRNAFKRAITNLVSNAARYADHIRLSTKIVGDSLFLFVDDDGPGIPEEAREKVFAPFYRLDDARTQHEGANTGLGLAIARDIIHSHGGSIKLGDSPMGGLRVSIQLPL